MIPSIYLLGPIKGAYSLPMTDEGNLAPLNNRCLQDFLHPLCGHVGVLPYLGVPFRGSLCLKIMVFSGLYGGPLMETAISCGDDTELLGVPTRDLKELLIEMQASQP